VLGSAGLLKHAPAAQGYVNTAACKSTISYIDGDKGILRYRGYPIEQLAERSNYTEARPRRRAAGGVRPLTAGCPCAAGVRAWRLADGLGVTGLAVRDVLSERCLGLANNSSMATVACL
jgi:hypothetical protein